MYTSERICVGVNMLLTNTYIIVSVQQVAQLAFVPLTTAISIK